MLRDLDLIRQILLDIESGKKLFSTLSKEGAIALGLPEVPDLSMEEANKLEHHLSLIKQQNFVTFHRAGNGTWLVNEITWQGHDLIDSVRDPKIWTQTKAGAQSAGGWTLDLLAEIAKGFVKKKLEQHTGVVIDS